MPDILLWPLSGARPGQGPIRRSGEFSNVRSGAFYSAINTRAHLGVETQRQWTDKAIARTTPALLGLYSLISRRLS